MAHLGHLCHTVAHHRSQQAHVNQACTRPGHAVSQAERSKVTEFRRIAEDAGQYDFVPYAVESYGRLGASAQSFLKHLSVVADSRGSASQVAFSSDCLWRGELCTAARVGADVWAVVV
jgi:hypothetical protein